MREERGEGERGHARARARPKVQEDIEIKVREAEPLCFESRIYCAAPRHGSLSLAV
jgi:hypothetical protein